MEAGLKNCDGFRARLRLAIGGRSVAVFGIECGIPFGMLHLYLSGGREPTRPRIAAMSHAAGVRQWWLLTGEGVQRAEEGELDTAGFAERLRFLSAERPTASGFAHVCGIPNTNMHSYLHLGREPTRRYLTAVARNCGADPEWLLSGAGSRVALESGSALAQAPDS